MSAYDLEADDRIRPVADTPRKIDGRLMVTRLIKAGGLFGLGVALALVVALLLGWPPLAASSPEISLTVVDRPGEANSGRVAVVEHAENQGFKLIGRREEALKPDSSYFHQFFRLDSHIFISRSFDAGKTEVDFRKSVVPMSRSAGELRHLAESFERHLTKGGFVVQVHSPDNGPLS